MNEIQDQAELAIGTPLAKDPIRDKNDAKIIFEVIKKIEETIMKDDPTGFHLTVLALAMDPFGCAKVEGIEKIFYTAFNQKKYDIRGLENELREKYLYSMKTSAASLIDWIAFSAEDIIDIASGNEYLLGYIIEMGYIEDESVMTEIANAMKNVTIWVAFIECMLLPKTAEECVQQVSIRMRAQLGDAAAMAAMTEINTNAMHYEDFFQYANAENQSILAAAIEYLERPMDSPESIVSEKSNDKPSGRNTSTLH